MTRMPFLEPDWCRRRSACWVLPGVVSVLALMIAIFAGQFGLVNPVRAGAARDAADPRAPIAAEVQRAFDQQVEDAVRRSRAALFSFRR